MTYAHDVSAVGFISGFKLLVSQAFSKSLCIKFITNVNFMGFGKYVYY